MQTTYTQPNSRTGLASLNARFIAFSLDIVLLLILVGVTDFFTFSSDEQALLLKPERLLHLLLAWLYFAGTETCACQGTLGKHLMNLKVTDVHGKRLTFKAASTRFFAKPISIVVVTLQYVFNLKSASPVTFHDKLAHSQVITR